MIKLQAFLHAIRVIKEIVETFFKCLTISLTYDKTWRINGKLLVVRPNFFHNRGTIVIGKRFHAQADIRHNVFGIIQPNVLNVLPRAEIIMGDNVGISGSTISAFQSITIGNNVLIGSGCVICDSDAHPIIPVERNNSAKTKIAPIVIEDDVFIGARSIILKGVTIGHGTVIGAGSVVTKNIPAMCVAAGNPAVVIKEISNYET